MYVYLVWNVFMHVSCIVFCVCGCVCSNGYVCRCAEKCLLVRMAVNVQTGVHFRSRIFI